MHPIILSQLSCATQQVRALQTERDTFEQQIIDLKDELAAARYQIQSLQRDTFAANDAAVSAICGMDSEIKTSIKALTEDLKIISDGNKIATLAYSLEVAKSSKKSQESELRMLRTDNESLQNENRMLKSSLDYKQSKI